MAKFVKGDVVAVPFPFVLYSVGNLKIGKLEVVIEAVIEIIRK